MSPQSKLCNQRLSHWELIQDQSKINIDQNKRGRGGVLEIIFIGEEKKLNYKEYAPSMERLKQPKRSPASESAPHWRTIAPGTYVSTTLEIIYKMEI